MPKEGELAGVVRFPKTRSEIIMPDVLTTLKLFIRRNVQTLKKVETQVTNHRLSITQIQQLPEV